MEKYTKIFQQHTGAWAGTTLFLTRFLPSSFCFPACPWLKIAEKSALKLSHFRFLSTSTVLTLVCFRGCFFKHSSSMLFLALSDLESNSGSDFKPPIVDPFLISCSTLVETFSLSTLYCSLTFCSSSSSLLSSSL